MKLTNVYATAVAILLGVASAEAEPLRVCATIPDLADITAAVGGDEVEVESFAKGPQDPHFLEVKPSFVKRLSKADLLVQVGMELEVGWLPLLLQNARNEKVLPGNPGNFDASRAITPLEVPVGTVDRSMGDVHARGNPHFLIDPLNGIAVAEALTSKLSELRPEQKDYFQKRLATFKSELGDSLWGHELVAQVGIDKLVQLSRGGQLSAWLNGQGLHGKLGGWMAALDTFPDKRVVADHNIWPYLAKRTGIEITGFLEPKPGVSPTTSHLKGIIHGMKAEHIKLILTTPYFDPRHAEFTAKATGGHIVQIAHQNGALPGADGYIGTVNYNFRALTEALKETNG